MLSRLALFGALGLAAATIPAMPASAQELVRCAREGGYCSVPYPTTVVYGARGLTTSLGVGPRGIPCNNGQFGDPAPGIRKQCFFVARDRGYRGYRRY